MLLNNKANSITDEMTLKLHTSEYLSFTKKEIHIIKKNLKNVFNENISTIDSSFINKATYTDLEVERWKGIDPERIKRILKDIVDINYMYSLFNTAITNNYITFPSPFSDKNLISNTSFTAMNTVFLRFFDEGEVFYISQHYNYVDIIYFPQRDLIISFDGGGTAWANEVKHFGNMIVSKFEDYLEIINNKEKTFGGIIISDDSPYHFFYNHMFCTELLYEKEILQKVKNVYSIVKEWCYFDIQKVYEKCSFDFKILTDIHINAITDIAKNREFYLNGSLL
ncbi:hypothetical protein, partial [Sulfurimonas sp.]|uniref:hypothetical protein n=1 Tax=Sulfurimonas sp. TaxID=2022749 RepID=UPI003D0ABECF